VRSLPASTIGLATLITVLLPWMPVVTNAQRAGTARVGFLATGSLSTPKSAYVFRVFRESLRSLGYVEGQNQ